MPLTNDTESIENGYLQADLDGTADDMEPRELAIAHARARWLHHIETCTTCVARVAKYGMFGHPIGKNYCHVSNQLALDWHRRCGPSGEKIGKKV